MADQDQADLDDMQKQQDGAPAPGGRASRGPSAENPDRRFEPDALVPPYEGRSQDSKTGAAAEADHKAFRPDEYAPPPGEGREISDEERSGMDSTEMNPEGPHGVGRSFGGRAEDLADRDPEERAESGVHGQSGRPYGSPNETDSVGAQDNTTGPPTQRT